MPTSQPATAFHVPDWLSYFFQYKSYGLLFVCAAFCTAVATPLYILIARRLGWVDQPSSRKQHARATPTMGGLVIFGVVFAGAMVALNLNNRVGEQLREHRVAIYGLMACTFCMMLLGMVDDRHALPPRTKLLVQSVVAIAAVSLGFQVHAVTLPFLESVSIPVPVSVVISLLWIVGITNAINLTDGLDGLAAGICFLASAVNGVVAIWLGNYYMAVMMVLLAGAILGFLRWNFHPARVFLGDTGALGLGMYLALASLHSAQKSHTVVLIFVPLFALGYPIFDTLLAVARRMARGQPLFTSDRDHIHHRLLMRGASPSAAAVKIYAVAIMVSILCIAAMTSNHFVVGLGLVGVLLLALFSARVLGYLEWGGWTARWSGREETRVLHAAATLARMRMERVQTEQELPAALATIAPEIGCVAICIRRGAMRAEWREDGPPDPGNCRVFETQVREEVSVQFSLRRTGELDEERRQLLGELGQLAGERLIRLRPPANGPA